MHFCVLKSKTIKFVLCIALVVLLLSLSIDGSTSAQVYLGYAPRRVPIYGVDTAEKQVAISFDAAWGADKTEKILDILDEFDVGATFFLVGIWIDEYPDLVKEIDARGYEIGTHSNSHPDMSKIDKDTMKKELQTSISKLENITGKKVKLFRPPFGAYNNALIDVADNLGLKTIQWSIDTLDWKGISAKEICSRVESKLHSGAIILMHNNSDNILDGLRLVLTTIQNKGYRVTSIGDLVYETNYTIDQNGIQHQ